MIIVYIVTSMIIEENKSIISLMKIFGYRRKEVGSLILNSSTIGVVMRYMLGIQKAKIIYALAVNGIPTMLSKMPSTKMLVLESVRVLHMIDKTFVSILAQMRELASGLKEYDVVMAMPGVGNILGPRIIAKIGDARRFHSGSALVADAGLDAPPYQSGIFTGTNRHISKRGSSSLRKTRYEIIRFLKCVKPTKDTAVYDFLLKKEAEGPPHA